MYKLKLKMKTKCSACSNSLNRTKSFNVTSANKENAIEEVRPLINKWQNKMMESQTCKTCQSIVDDVALDIINAYA